MNAASRALGIDEGAHTMHTDTAFYLE
jgi:hypothetical protein